MCNEDDNADIGDDNSSGDGQEDYGDVLMMMMDQDAMVCQKTDTCSR